MAEVFISYAREDKDFVQKLHNALAGLNRDTWVDWEGIPLTAEWLKEVYAGIEAADNFIFVISLESVGSEACQKEVAHAAINKKRLIPILHRPVPEESVPPVLGAINRVFFQDTDDFRATFASLIEALDTDLDWKRTHTRLLVRAKEWEDKGRDDSFLLRGMDLQDALHWLAQAIAIQKQEPSPLHREYIQASQEWEAGEIQRLKELNEEKERQRQEAERQQRIATARELVAYGLSSLEEYPERALLLALHAINATFRDGQV